MGASASPLLASFLHSSSCGWNWKSKQYLDIRSSIERDIGGEIERARRRMMLESMDAARIIGYFKGKSILITGSTGFLGKILVEKILRVQPHVNKMYLLVRGIDEPSAKQRVQQEVIGTELFGLLREKHEGKGFQQLVEEKVVALAGDIIYRNLGLEAPMLEELAKDIDVIVNIAATTNFYERYDVSLDVNVMGVKHLCEFAKQCARLKMLMHVSTAFMSGDREGLILEKIINPGESLRDGTYLDIDAELRLVREVKKELTASDDTQKTERKAMKELGIQRARHFGWSNTYVFTKAMGEMLLGQLRGDMPVVIMRPSIITSVRADPLPGWMQGTRTIDTLIIGYAKQNLSCFLADLSMVMDVIPGDMVVNAMMAAMVAHSEEKGAQVVYNVTSSLRNPATYSMLYEGGRRYFYQNPRVGENGEVIPTKEMYFFTTITRFRLFMFLTYKLPLEILHLVNLLFCGFFSRLYNEMNRKYKLVMLLVDVYGPFVFFRGCFDDMNMERLRLTMAMKTPEDQMFNFDPKIIDWEDYFYRIHIPGVLKYVCK